MNAFCPTGTEFHYRKEGNSLDVTVDPFGQWQSKLSYHRKSKRKRAEKSSVEAPPPLTTPFAMLDPARNPEKDFPAGVPWPPGFAI